MEKKKKQFKQMDSNCNIVCVVAGVVFGYVRLSAEWSAFEQQKDAAAAAANFESSDKL